MSRLWFVVGMALVLVGCNAHTAECRNYTRTMKSFAMCKAEPRCEITTNGMMEYNKANDFYYQEECDK